MVRLLILIFLICSQNCYCQDSIGVSEKIKIVGGKWEIDGRKLNATELEREVYKNSNAIPHYKRYKRRRTLGYVFGTATVASGIIYSLAMNRFENPKSAWKPLTVIATGSATIFFFLSSNSSINKAVKVRNLGY